MTKNSKYEIANVKNSERENGERENGERQNSERLNSEYGGPLRFLFTTK